MSEVEKVSRRVWHEPAYPFKPVKLPPNTLTNADGTPYAAGYDEAAKEAKLEELVHTAMGEVSMCWSERPKGVFQDEKAKKIGEELIKAIKELYA